MSTSVRLWFTPPQIDQQDVTFCAIQDKDNRVFCVCLESNESTKKKGIPWYFSDNVQQLFGQDCQGVWRDTSHGLSEEDSLQKLCIISHWFIRWDWAHLWDTVVDPPAQFEQTLEMFSSTMMQKICKNAQFERTWKENRFELIGDYCSPAALSYTFSVFVAWPNQTQRPINQSLGHQSIWTQNRAWSMRGFLM